MATLKTLVDETTNIKNELVECHSNLKNNLIAKGVECSDIDKMSSLIDKVKGINAKYIASDNVAIWFSKVMTTYYYRDGIQEAGYLKSNFSGSIRIKFEIQSNLEVWICVNRNGEEIYSTSRVRDNIEHSIDISNIEVGDEIFIHTRCYMINGSGIMKWLCMGGDIV